MSHTSSNFSPLEKTAIQSSYSNLNITPQSDLIYVTGGALILAIAKTLGFSESDFDSDKHVVVAGKDFSVRGLWLIWKFYSALSFAGMKFACVDERLLPDTSDSGIHEHCGAAAAATEILNKNSGSEVEDFALQTLGRERKQEIISEIKDEHVSVGILISCGDTYGLSADEKENRLHNVGDLPFNISFPVEKIKIFANNLSQEDRDLFIKTLIDWNCGIVLRIIAGDHNLRSSEVMNVGLNVTLVNAPEDEDLIKKLIESINENLVEIYSQNVPEVNVVRK